MRSTLLFVKFRNAIATAAAMAMIARGRVAPTKAVRLAFAFSFAFRIVPFVEAVPYYQFNMEIIIKLSCIMFEMLHKSASTRALHLPLSLPDYINIIIILSACARFTSVEVPPHFCLF